MPKPINITGKHSGRLIAIRPIGKDAHGKISWLCRCVCGRFTVVPAGAFQCGRIRSCKHHKNGSNNPNYRHGLAKNKTSKGHPLYATWCGIRARCNDPNHPRYKDYGGRGIKVCRRWNSFSNFLVDVGERPSKEFTIERINNNAGYKPSNVKWATRKEQNANKRSSPTLSWLC